MSTLSAGVCRMAITPPPGTDLAGYAARDGAATGVHDELFATALVLKQDAVRVALVSTDLIGLDREAGAAIRAEVERETGIPPGRVMIVSTHTHSGPVTDLFPAGMGRRDPVYLAWLRRAVAGAVAGAAGDLRPAWISAGCGSVRAGANRRTRQGLPGIPADPDGPVDPELGVVRISGRDGTPIAHIVSYACHAVCLGHDNRLVSADYPGVVRRTVEDLLGGTVLFLNGACGDINPLWRDTFETARRVGTAVGAEAVKTSLLLGEPERPDVSMRCRETRLPRHAPFSREELRTTVRENREKLERKRRTLSAWDRNEAEARLHWARELLLRMEAGPLETDAPATLRALLLGGTAIVSIPGEVLVELGLAVKRQSPFLRTFVAGYADGLLGYIPTRRAIAEGGYEPNAHVWYGGLPFLPAVHRVLLAEVRSLLGGAEPADGADEADAAANGAL